MKYTLLGNSGLRVSRLCLGTMTFGTEWGYGADREESKNQFDAFVGAGGNFIDTANYYTKGTSEKYVGEFVHSNREELVIATKYTLNTNAANLNTGGNHKKNLVQAVESSLNNMKLDYIDILWVHVWDFTVRPQELMRWLNDLTATSKVLHIGISDTPAWIMATCNTLAECNAWEQFSAIQVEYSLLQRTPERDLLPMAKTFNMGVTAWSPLAAGLLTGKYLTNREENSRIAEDSNRIKNRNVAVEQAVVDVANEITEEPANVALAWILQQNNSYIPIIGARTGAQIASNTKAVELVLDQNHIDKLNEVSKISMGFPHDFVSTDSVKNVIFGEKKFDLNR